MKKIMISALVLGLYAASVNAFEENSDHLMFPEDMTQTQVKPHANTGLNNRLTFNVAANDDQRDAAIQRKSISRRAYQSRKVEKNDQYDEQQEWIGATQKIEAENRADHIKSLNRRFMSRRALRH